MSNNSRSISSVESETVDSEGTEQVESKIIFEEQESKPSSDSSWVSKDPELTYTESVKSEFVQKASLRPYPNFPNFKKATKNRVEFSKERLLIPLSEELQQERGSLPNKENIDCMASATEYSNSSHRDIHQSISVDSIVPIIKKEVKSHIADLKLSQEYIKREELVTYNNMLINRGSKSYTNVGSESNSENASHESGKESNILIEFRDFYSKDDKTIDSESVCEECSVISSGERYNEQTPTTDTISTTTSRTLKTIQNTFMDNSLESVSYKDVQGSHAVALTNANNDFLNNNSSPMRVTFSMTEVTNRTSATATELLEPARYQYKILEVDQRLNDIEVQLGSRKEAYDKFQLLKYIDYKIRQRMAKMRRAHSKKRNAEEDQNVAIDKIGDYKSDTKLLENGGNRKKTDEKSDDEEDEMSFEISPYDESYYEWRQYSMNMLRYKKSQRTIRLNQRPMLQYTKPPKSTTLTNLEITRRMLPKRPYFVIT